MRQLTDKENKIVLVAIYIQYCIWIFQMLIYEILGNGLVMPVYICVSAIRGITLFASAYLWIKYRAAEAIVGYVVCFFIYALQMLIYPENRSYVNQYVFDFFVLCLPCYLNMRSVDNETLHIKIVGIFSWVVFILGEIYFILFSNKFSHDETYSMTYSYYMLFSAVVFIYMFFEKRKRLYIIPAGFAMFSMLVIGSRGAVVAGAMYFFVLLFLSKKNKILRCTLIAVLIGVFINIEKLTRITAEVTRQLGVNSRTIDFLLAGEFISHDSGRINIYSQAVELIKEHWYIGNGIGADERILQTYTHNLFLDLFVQFGIVMGTIVIIVMLCVMAIGFIKAEDKAFYLLFFFLGFFPLMVSGTYLNQIVFWAYMGFCMSKIQLRFRWNRVSAISEKQTKT